MWSENGLECIELRLGSTQQISCRERCWHIGAVSFVSELSAENKAQWWASIDLLSQPRIENSITVHHSASLIVLALFSHFLANKTLVTEIEYIFLANKHHSWSTDTHFDKGNCREKQMTSILWTFTNQLTGGNTVLDEK